MLITCQTSSRHFHFRGTPKKEQHQREEKVSGDGFGVSLMMRQDSVEYGASVGGLSQQEGDKEHPERGDMTPFGGRGDAKKGYEAVVCEEETDEPVKKNIVS